MKLGQLFMMMILLIGLVGCGDYAYNYGSMLPGAGNPGYNVSY